MKKNRKFIVIGVIAAVAVLGICLYAYAENNDDDMALNSGNISTGSAATSEESLQDSVISAEQAGETAVNSAVLDYGIKESSVRDMEVDIEYEGGKDVWEVTFDAADQNDKYCEFEYLISRTDGSILYRHLEYDDVDDIFEDVM